MRQFCVPVIIILCELLSLQLSAQKWLIVGRNKDNPDGFSIVCTENVTSSDIVYITEDEYSCALDNFATGESITKYTPPAGGHLKGEVIAFAETGGSTNVVTVVGCSSGTCGTATNVGGTFAVGSSNDQLYAYSDTDDNPGNGVTEIYCFWRWNSSTNADDPVCDFPSSKTVNISGDISKIDYTSALRTNTLTPVEYQNSSNYSLSGSNSALSLTPFSGDIILPVELSYFTGIRKGDSNQLEWKTLSEINNEMFEIQRSENGWDFNKIGEVEGSGNTSIVQSYKFIDHSPLQGFNYYRLKQMDFDGQFDYSNVIRIQYSNGNGRIGEFYPNPSHLGYSNLDYTSSEKQNITASIFDISGKLVFNNSYFVSEGENILNFDFSKLDKGIYVIKIHTYNQSNYRKLIID